MARMARDAKFPHQLPYHAAPAPRCNLGCCPKDEDKRPPPYVLPPEYEKMLRLYPRPELQSPILTVPRHQNATVIGEFPTLVISHPIDVDAIGL